MLVYTVQEVTDLLNKQKLGDTEKKKDTAASLKPSGLSYLIVR